MHYEEIARTVRPGLQVVVEASASFACGGVAPHPSYHLDHHRLFDRSRVRSWLSHGRGAHRDPHQVDQVDIRQGRNNDLVRGLDGRVQIVETLARGVGVIRATLDQLLRILPRAAGVHVVP